MTKIIGGERLGLDAQPHAAQARRRPKKETHRGKKPRGPAISHGSLGHKTSSPRKNSGRAINKEEITRGFRSLPMIDGCAAPDPTAGLEFNTKTAKKYAEAVTTLRELQYNGVIKGLFCISALGANNAPKLKNDVLAYVVDWIIQPQLGNQQSAGNHIAKVKRLVMIFDRFASEETVPKNGNPGDKFPARRGEEDKYPPLEEGLFAELMGKCVRAIAGEDPLTRAGLRDFKGMLAHMPHSPQIDQWISAAEKTAQK